MEAGVGSKEDGSGGRQAGGSYGSGSSSAWTPLVGAFRPYQTFNTCSTSVRLGGLETIVRKPLVARLTKEIVETFLICNPDFRFSEILNPKRFITSPSDGVLNDGYDNKDNDLVLYVNSILVNAASKQRYIVKELLGQGTFGQVAKCWTSETDNYVAVKIIKNQPAYYQQALVEVSILLMLNQKVNSDEHYHIVRILDYFVYQRHLCISFELLSSNLYELIKLNQFRGFPLNIVRRFSSQVMLDLDSTGPDIKIIDFGSACLEGRTVYSYIQSRYYRSPEVLLGYPYTAAVDMWSFGCIVAELFLGLPLFAGASEFDLLQRMIEILGEQPPDDLLRDAQNTNKFFKHVGSIYRLGDEDAYKGVIHTYRVLTAEEYEARESKKPVIGKRYFNYVKLEDVIAKYPFKKNLLEEEVKKEILDRLKLVDFLRGLVEFDPAKRWSPLQASNHPFITGEALTCPYNPPPESLKIRAVQSVTVDHHNPGGGHWLAAGLSPQVQNVNRSFTKNSPQFSMVPLSHGGSYGSMGSHGSYIDNYGIGSSYGSYGDPNNMQTYFSPVGPYGMNVQAQVGVPFLGTSPDTWRRPHRHGSLFGVSPTGNLGPMSLGASPSQFTPPSSQVQISTVSPGKYGSSSPARGSLHGSPLSKAAVVAQYNRRRAWGNPGSSAVQLHESSSQHWQGYHNEGSVSSQLDNYSHVQFSSRGSLASSNNSYRRQQMSGGRGPGLSANTHLSHPPSTLNSNAPPSHTSLASGDKYESSLLLPDPADWDPNYSDELLLQEDNYDVSSLSSGIANGMQLGNVINPATLTSGVTRLSHNVNQASTSSSSRLLNQRTDGQFQAHSLDESNPHSTNDLHAGFSRLPNVAQNSPSRFSQQSQQPFNRYNNHMQSTSMHGLRTQQKGQPSRSTYNVPDSRSAANNMFSNSMQWGNLCNRAI
ncbi:Serine/threonine-protein kinase AFC1 [Platanthera zijinensis]|uniref:Serine/threonine-protein kinase AFC1 n=1 Tax=Platanthera zijinensis TaxID=2320716 RepID=A0AAP0G976_9ASPA